MTRHSGDSASECEPSLDGADVSGQLDLRLEEVHRRRTDERGDEHVDGLVVQVLRGVHLLEIAVLEHRDAVPHRHRLDLVVGDVHGGDGELALQRGDLGAHLHAQLRVEVREGLVHQERRGLAHDRTAHRDPLTLATGQLAGLAVEVALQLEVRGGLADASVDLVLRAPSPASTAKPMLSYTVMCGYSA